MAARGSPEQELRRLRRENRALLRRREILKKTAGIFSEANASVSREFATTDVRHITPLRCKQCASREGHLVACSSRPPHPTLDVPPRQLLR
jgi:hypothetical protein